MQRMKVVKILAVAAMLLILNVNGAGLSAEQSYVDVKLRDGKVEKFQYQSFHFGEFFTIKVKEQVTCEEVEVDKDDIDEVYFVSEFYNTCDDKDDWEVTLYLTDKEEILGFLVLSDYAIHGKLHGKEEEKTIPFKDIKKISFRR